MYSGFKVDEEQEVPTVTLPLQSGFVKQQLALQTPPPPIPGRHTDPTLLAGVGLILVGLVLTTSCLGDTGGLVRKVTGPGVLAVGLTLLLLRWSVPTLYCTICLTLPQGLVS
jgi:hypothetical protein